MDKQIAGIAAAYLVVELSKFIIGKFFDKNSMSPRQELQLKTLYDMHMVKDESGKPIWYMSPRVLQIQEKILDHQQHQQEKILNVLDGITKTQNDTAHVLNRILDKLADMRERECPMVDKR